MKDLANYCLGCINKPCSRGCPLNMAVGSHPDEQITTNLNINLDKKGRIEVNENNQTSNQKIFAGGDISGAEGTVAFAARSGRNAVNNIIDYQNKKSFK